MIPKIFALITITYLVFTFIFRSAYPQDHYYYLVGQPITTDSLIFIRTYSVSEFDAHGGGTYYPGSKRLPNSWLDTNWNYYLVANCINNLYQPFYVNSVSVIDGDSKLEYEISCYVSVKTEPSKTSGQSIISGKSLFQLNINSPGYAYNDLNRFKNDSLLKVAFDSRNIEFILKTSIGRFIFRPQQYRFTNSYGANTRE